MTPDSNDLVYNTYGIDLVGLVRYLYEIFGGTDWVSVTALLSRIWNIYSIVAIMLSALFFVIFIYAKVKFGQLAAVESEALHEEEHKWAERHGGEAHTEGRWAEIQRHIRDDNPNSWKIAIIEADIFLEEILTTAGYVGATIGEKLKGANPNSFTTVQDAWEAHKIRNEIAHASGDFVLTRRAAQETLTRYERVFREFGAI